MNSIQDHRDFYANFIVRSVASSDPRLIAAFASTPREHYVGAAPWPIFVGSGYLPALSDDPRLLYQDVLVGLATDRGINNGQPTLHARCLAACATAQGESVVQIGAGTGYYTAILATLVGPGGSVVAYEVEADLAARARENLRDFPNVRVISASAAEAALPKADVIYVSAGATHPPGTWLDALNVGGRLIFPLTPDQGYGGMLLVTRCGESAYAAAIIARVSFVPCVGARDSASAKALAIAFERHSIQAVKSLRRDTKPDDTAWFVGAGWWLSTADAD